MIHRPVLYLSIYLKRHRSEYYDWLMAIREEGDWEGWLKFFVRGVAETAEEATRQARAIIELREQQRERIQEAGLPTNALRVLDLIYDRPLFDIALAVDRLGVSFATANKLVEQLGELGLVDEITGRKRGRIFRFSAYMALFEDEDGRPDSPLLVEETEAVDETESVEEVEAV